MYPGSFIAGILPGRLFPLCGCTCYNVATDTHPMRRMRVVPCASSLMLSGGTWFAAQVFHPLSRVRSGTDLFSPICAQGGRWHDATNGQHTIGEITHSAPAPLLARSCQYDQATLGPVEGSIRVCRMLYG